MNASKKSDPALAEPRARRALRREKQRAANIGRAKKMHLARKAHEAESPKAKINTAPRINIGCSGWFYWDWRGKFYPSSIPPNQWFSHYAEHFKTVELNAPFYSWPTLATVQSWVRQAKDSDFTYTIKVCELITHIKRFRHTKELIKDFGLIADILGPRMGCFLFQLPPSYHYTPARLKAITAQLDPERRNVVEFRHASWWNERVYKAFEKADIIFCACSGPKLPDELVKTADDIYIRFHGTKRWYQHDYTLEELGIWAARIRQSRAKHVWIYFNNDRNGYAIKNAKELLTLLSRNK